ncbi:MAG TPA: hypothetical protein VHD32_12695 [Candidatus Didemnitutus sp.]|nr:hypothetical protein [Candidatus Didemnitutus sp.]
MSTRTLPQFIFAAENTPRPARVVDFILGAVLGCGFTAMLFSAIAYSEHFKPHQAPPPLADLAAVAAPLEAPPPLPSHENAPEAPAPAGLDLPAPSSTATVKDAASLLPEFVLLPSKAESAMPSASIDLHLPNQFRPRTYMPADNLRIYQRQDVDRVASIISEKKPYVDRRDMGSDVLHLNLIWVVEADGTVSNVTIGQTSGNPKIDGIMVEAIKESLFSPAMKGGRRVRMMTSQSIKVSFSGGDLFH